MKQEYDKIPVNIAMLILILLFIVPACIYLIVTWEQNSYDIKIGTIVVLILTGFMFMEFARSYRLSKEGIDCFLCGIPVRKVRWSQIIQVGVAKRDDGLRFSNSVSFIILTICGGTEFDPYNDKGYIYLKHNRGNIIKIDNPDKYLEVIEKYYGPINYDVRTFK